MDTTVLSSSMDLITSNIVEALVVAIASLGSIIAVQIARFFNRGLNAQQEAQIRSKAKNVILWVEEKSAMKQKLENTVLKGRDKLDMAVTALQAKYPKLPVKKAEEIILSALASTKGIGSRPEIGE